MLPELFKNFTRISVEQGEVILAGELQGRIFVAMDGEVLHRLVLPSTVSTADSFQNIGGNSLWPAPEGGAFAFNYPADGGPWRVQEGINKAVSAVQPDGVGMTREIVLENRKGLSAKVLHSRQLAFPCYGLGEKYDVQSVVYRSCDRLELLQPLPAEDFLMVAWSLEQFELTSASFGFGILEGGVNVDFYGDPSPWLFHSGKTFRFDFKAPERLQIGLPEAGRPELVGACLPERELLILRRIVRVDPGVRINFADNEQPGGVYSASDAYSIFHGADQKFFELETLAPVRIQNGLTTGSLLETETHFYRGSRQRLLALLRNEFNVDLEF